MTADMPAPIPPDDQAARIAEFGAAAFYGDCLLCMASNPRGFSFQCWYGDTAEQVRERVQAHIDEKHGSDFVRVWPSQNRQDAPGPP
jgi:hypothetical protein